MNAQTPISSVTSSPRAEASIVIGSEVFLYGVIDPYDVRAIDMVAALAELRHLDTITVRINSPGGSVYEGLAIYDALRMSGKRIVVRIDALAASIASVIAMAADELVFAEDARLMIHNPFSYAAGEAEDLRKLANELDNIKNRLVDIYLRKAGNKLTAERLVEMMSAETYLSAQEAFELGLADRVDEPLKVAARAPDTVNRTLGYLLARPSTETNSSAIPASSTIAAEAAPHEVNMSLNNSRSETPAEIENRVRSTVTGIYNTVRIANIDNADTVAADMINRGLTLDQARAEVFDIMASAQPQAHRQHIVISNGRGHANGEEIVNEIVQGVKSGSGVHAAMAQVYEATTGRRAPRNKAELVSAVMGSGARFLNSTPGMHTRSDFPHLLEKAGNLIVREGYEAAPSPWDETAVVLEAQDFRPLFSLRLSDPQPFTEVTEAGEITSTTRTEEGESVVLKTYAKEFSIARQAAINDQFGVFGSTLAAFGRAAALTRQNLMASVFTANGGNGMLLSDGMPLFHVNRGNKAATGSPLNVASLSTARAAIRTTRDIDGATLLNLVPAYLVVGPALETEAEQILSVINATQISDVNPFGGTGKLKLLVEPRITDKSWRLFASKASAPILSIAYLQGNQAPILETKEHWTVLGTSYRGILDVGVGLLGWRGSYLNPGE